MRRFHVKMKQRKTKRRRTLYKKYLWTSAKYLIPYLFMPLIFSVGQNFVIALYNALSESLPQIFKEYNQVLDKEAYLSHIMRCRTFTLFSAAFIMSFAAAIFDNGRYERTVKKTDGYFKIPEELPSYVKSTIFEDLAASLTVPLPFFLLSLIKFPETAKAAARLFSSYFSPHIFLTESYGLVLGYLLIVSSAIIAKLIAAPMALRRHRSLWLTSFVDD